MKKIIWITLAAIVLSVGVPTMSKAATAYKLTVNGVTYQITEEQYSFIRNTTSSEEKLALFESLGVDTSSGRLSYTLTVTKNANEMEEGSPFYVVDACLKGYQGKAATVVIPSQAKTIGEGAFLNNTSVQVICFPRTVTSISAKAFYGCTKLKHFVAPAGSAAYKYAKANGIPVITTQTVKVKDSSITMLKGDVTTPFVYNNTSKINWNSTNTKVVKRSGNGKVKALRKGSARIYTTINGRKLTIKVKVSIRSEDARVSQVIKNTIKKGMSQKEKVKAIHNWMIANVQYDYYNYLRGTVPAISHKAKGALLKGLAVCDGYSYAFKKFMSELGIKCKIMIGRAEGGGHAWNLVRVNGKWLHVDVTFDDPIINESNLNKRPYYTYFLKSSKQMKRTHSW